MVATLTSTLVTALLLFADLGLAQTCQGQSCYIAYLSGSTKTKYDLPKGSKQATGASASGEKCIRDNLAKLGITELPRKYVDTMSPGELRGAVEKVVMSETTPAVPPMRIEKRQGKGGACQSTIIIYARGTLEPGDLGMSVGPALQTQAKSLGWGIRGVGSSQGYGAGIADDYCVGLPGGIACKKMLEKVSAECPNSNFVLSGYSQGAMVARICAAYQTPEVQKRIKALVLYGDPMNGADVKGIDNNRVKTICNSNDGVCKGEFNITAGHMSYSSDGKSVKAGIEFAKQMTGKK